MHHSLTVLGSSMVLSHGWGIGGFNGGQKGGPKNCHDAVFSHLSSSTLEISEYWKMVSHSKRWGGGEPLAPP